MVLNKLQCTGQPQPQRGIWPERSIVQRLRNLASGEFRKLRSKQNVLEKLQGKADSLSPTHPSFSTKTTKYCVKLGVRERDRRHLLCSLGMYLEFEYK